MDEARMQGLEARVAELTAMVERLTAEQPATTSAAGLASELAENAEAAEPAVPLASSRRHLLRNAAIAAGGAVAVTVAGSSVPAAAAHQAEDLGLGIVNTTGGKTTANFDPGPVTPGGNAFLFQAGAVLSTDQTSFSSALAAWSTLSSYPNGLYGYTTQNGSGVVATGQGPGSFGLRANGVKAHLALIPNGLAAPSRTDAHGVGEVIEDGEGDLWACVGAGTPGTWRKLAGPASAGAFHAIAPLRVYDSRLPLQPANGKLVSLQSRVVSIADARDQTTGEVTVANIVPAGATAIVCNLTVTDTTGPFGGFLSIVPGDATLPSGSSINWFGINQNIANGITVKVDATRQVRVFAGGGGNPAAHFIIDINGYFR
jgi:hypothetical protein